ncbi:hypothetical protein V1514DRAFT_333599 [Lipomyces japonicus]|uniref:uncharacterized protein n=1 Tax=Lipomyces japonicus TaxID=56871 RepID=UPI0034CF3320
MGTLDYQAHGLGIQPPTIQTQSGSEKISKKKGRPRKQAKSLLAVVPPPPSNFVVTPIGAPHTPPPSAIKPRRRSEKKSSSSEIPETPSSVTRNTTGHKTVPSSFVTPKSVSRSSPPATSHELWQSSSPVGPDGSGLGIFVQPPIARLQDVDPILIDSQGQSGRSSQVYSYTKIFSSPIHYAPYLGKRSLSDYEALSSATMYDSRESKRAKVGLGPTSYLSGPQTPNAAGKITFSVSESGQAIVEHQQLVTPDTSRSRIPTDCSWWSEASSLSASDQDGDLSEAETEILDASNLNASMQHFDAREAIADIFRQRQIQHQIAQERKTKLQEKKRQLRKLKRHASSSDIQENPRLLSSQESLPSYVRSYSDLSVPVNAESLFLTRSAESLHQRASSLALQADYEMQLYAEKQRREHESISRDQKNLYNQGQQVEQVKLQEGQKKNKRGRPPKGQSQKQKTKNNIGTNEATRCVCGSAEWYGEPMVQCDNCQHWLHIACTNVDPNVKIQSIWYCPFCTGNVPHY